MLNYDAEYANVERLCPVPLVEIDAV